MQARESWHFGINNEMFMLTILKKKINVFIAPLVTVTFKMNSINTKHVPATTMGNMINKVMLEHFSQSEDPKTVLRPVGQCPHNIPDLLN